jgi:hypothetical protein
MSYEKVNPVDGAALDPSMSTLRDRNASADAQIAVKVTCANMRNLERKYGALRHLHAGIHWRSQYG